MKAAWHTNPTDPHEYVMAYLTSMTHPGLVILPAHRMVKGISHLDLGKFLAELRPYFNIEELCFNDQNRQSVFHTLIERIESYSEVGGKFGMIVQGEPCFRLLRLKDFHAAESLMDSSIPASLRALDVTILREAIMNYGLGMDGEMRKVK